jgi:hypothetical protein
MPRGCADKPRRREMYAKKMPSFPAIYPAWPRTPITRSAATSTLV